MKKQVKITKLSLNKFKIASISNFGKSRILGGEGNDDDDTGTKTTTSRNCETTGKCDKDKDFIPDAN